jgi:hypothetical protein
MSPNHVSSKKQVPITFPTSNESLLKKFSLFSLLLSRKVTPLILEWLEMKFKTTNIYYVATLATPLAH